MYLTNLIQRVRNCSIILGVFLLHNTALAQVYTEQYYPQEVGGPTALQKIFTGPAATLIMVLIGSAGIFNLFFSTDRGRSSDKGYLIGTICMILVIMLFAYRCSLWNDPNFTR